MHYQYQQEMTSLHSSLVNSSEITEHVARLVASQQEWGPTTLEYHFLGVASQWLESSALTSSASIVQFLLFLGLPITSTEWILF